MNENKNLAKELPPMEGEFDIDVKGDITGKMFRGTFSCKLMNRKEQAMVAKHKAFLNGDLADKLDLNTLRYHHQISYLRYALIEPYPKFWKTNDLGYELYDGNVVGEVYNKVLEFEENWMKQVWGEEAVNALKEEDNDEQKEESGEKDA